jgi:hypothetical protein
VVGATIFTVWAQARIITWESESFDFILYLTYVKLKDRHPSDPDLQSYKAFYKSVTYPRRVEWLELSEVEGIAIPSELTDTVKSNPYLWIPDLLKCLPDSEGSGSK